MVVCTWGASFTVIKLGLGDVPPMLLGCLRYLLSAFPALLFFPRPRVAWKWWILYGMTVGVGQFALLFLAVRLGFPAGVASVALQSQAFFTLMFARYWLDEPIRPMQVAGIALAGAGLWMLIHAQGGTQAASPWAGVLVVGAAASWAASNIVLKQARADAGSDRAFHTLGFIVWTGLVPPIPFLILSWWSNEIADPWAAIAHISTLGWFSIAYLALGGTILGNGIYSRLLTKYPASTVAPLTLLVPVIGLAVANVVLDEAILAIQYVGCGLIFLGLVATTLLDARSRPVAGVKCTPPL